jgi:hypothetical protein
VPINMTPKATSIVAAAYEPSSNSPANRNDAISRHIKPATIAKAKAAARTGRS